MGLSSAKLGPEGRDALPRASGPLGTLRSQTTQAKAQKQGAPGRPCAIGVHESQVLWEDVGGRAGESGWL